MQQGIYIYGELKGVASTEWKKGDKHGLNHDIGIAVQTEGKWGAKEHLYEIECSDNNVHDFIAQAEKLVGTNVRIKVGMRAISYGQGQAFEKYFVLKESVIEPVK